jgi:hypothetical protein
VTRRVVPPDDDPRFQRWLNEVGPPPPSLFEPDEEQWPVARPVVAGVAMGAAILGMATAVGLAWALAFRVIPPVVAGGGLVITVAVTAGCLYYLLSRAS